MKLALYDPEKSGFARYCPTFKAAFDRLTDCVGRKAQERRENARLNSCFRQMKAEPIVEAIAADPKKAEFVSRFIFDRDRNTMILACHALRLANGRGADITPAVPKLVRAFTHHDFFMRLQAMNTVCEALPSLGREARLEAAAGAESFVRGELDSSVITDPGGAPLVFESLLKLMRSIAELEGVHPLILGKLISELKTHPKAAADRCLGE